MLHCGACIPVMWTGKRPERKERLRIATPRGQAQLLLARARTLEKTHRVGEQ